MIHKSLGKFCKDMRSARRGTSTTTAISEDRIKALDELGFDWGGARTSRSRHIEGLKPFKAKHGHVRVTVKHDNAKINSYTIKKLNPEIKV